jgi:hypothetical protein
MDTPTIEAPPIDPALIQLMAATVKEQVATLDKSDKAPTGMLPSIRTIGVIDGKPVLLKIQAVVWKLRDMVVTASRYEGEDHDDNFKGVHVTSQFCEKFGLDESETARVLAYRAKADDLLITAI